MNDGGDRATRKVFDWRAGLALAWAIGFGLLYGRAMIEARAPRALKTTAIRIR